MKSIKFRTLLLLGVALVLFGCGLTKDEDQLIIDRSQEIYESSERWKDLLSYSKKSVLPEINEETRLDDYISFGLQNNFELRAAFDRWLSSMYAIPEARSIPDPQISFAYLLIPIETRTGAQIARYGLSQLFPWFGKYRLKGEIAAKKAEYEWWQVQKARLKLIQDIKTVYFEYAYLGQEISINEGYLVFLKQLEGISKSKTQVGGKQDKLLKLQNQILQFENTLVELKQSRTSISARFRALLNEHSDGNLPFPKLTPTENMKWTAASLTESMLVNNPDMKGYVERIALKAKADELSQKEGFPDIKLGVDRFETEKAKMPVKDSGKDPLSLMFSFTLPLDWEKYESIEKKAQSDLKAIHAEMGQRWNDLTAELALLSFRYNDLLGKIQLYKNELIPKEKQRWETVLAQYQTGATAIEDLIEIKQRLFDYEKTLWKLIANREIKRAEIETLIGGDVR